MSRWHRLFQLNDREWLEQNLNEFSRDYPDSFVERVWTDNDIWYAHVSYSKGFQPTYSTQEPSEPNS